MDYQENKKGEIIILLLSILLLVPLILISVYNRPSADDYSYGVYVHQVIENNGTFFEIIKAAWDTNIHMYNSWQGLYCSAFILALQPGGWGEQYYSLTTIIVMGTTWPFLIGSCHILNKYFVRRSFLFTLSASVVVFAILMLWLPSPNQGLYWYNGAMNYMPWIFADLLNACLMIEIWYENKSRKGIIILLLSTMLSFLISGGNHVTSFANILVLLEITVFLSLKRRYYSLVPFIAACVGFVIMYVAPGTAVRANVLNKQSVVKTIVATLNHLRGGIGWISLDFLLSLVIITPIAVEIAVKQKEKFSKRKLLVTVVSSIGIICGMFCVPYKAMGVFGEGRLTNVIWIAFMFLSWLIYIMIWGCLVSTGYINIKKNEKKHTWMNTLIISLGLVFLFVVKRGSAASSSGIALKELWNGTAQNYCLQMDERFLMYNDDALSEVAVSPLKVKSALLFFRDVGTDPATNSDIGNYYNKTIYLDESSTY